MIALNEISVRNLSGVGPKLAQLFAHLNIHTIQDLLLHLPLRYEDRTQITPIKSLQLGMRALVSGNILDLKIQGQRKTSLICTLADDTGVIHLRFFHFSSFQKERLNKIGEPLTCFGEVQIYKGEFEMVHPEFQDLKNLSNHLTPIYPSTKGLHQTQIRKLIDQAINLLKKNGIDELLPTSILTETNFSGFQESLLKLHQPLPQEVDSLSITHARKRLAFEELLSHQLSLSKSHRVCRSRLAPSLNAKGELRQSLEAALPYQLTRAQQRAIAEILADLKKSYPMLRLIQGDVGSGKTIVAAMATLECIELGFQAVIMAPTELLAEQHLQNFKRWFEPLKISLGWLSGNMSETERRETLKKISGGEISIVIGTHAIFQEKVVFAKLALLIVDEQHRFGVQQRLALQEKGKMQDYFPHQLIMTATPIPRSLAMAIYADLDCSFIDELPPGRKPITTVMISNNRRSEVLQRVYDNCRSFKRQAYWVCTLIEESEILQCQAAEATLADLKSALPHLNIALIHGRLKPEEKETIMQNFRKGMIDLLVATTVIEVGVDVPNASLMIIENPERLGLAQLHQLRGRVGRGATDSHCVLLYQAPLSQFALQRLLIMRETQDGFVIAQKDLEMRGPGEVLGTRQAGLTRMKVTDLLHDQDLIPKVQEAGKKINENYPDLIEPIIARWLTGNEEYVRV